MIRNVCYSILFLSFFISSAQIQKPKLVVGIIVDQMRQDYLYRYASKYGEGGFLRLVNKGYMLENTHYNYIPTKTAAGHASVYTGTTPRYHGIIANEWYSKEKGMLVYCAGDETVSTVGGSEYAGHISPRNLMSTTITDELKLSSNFNSKVVSVSIKDRGAALPAGHNPDGAYWYDDKTGNFVTSTYYTEKLPKWASDFNDLKLVDKYSNKKWKPLLDKDSYTESTADNTPYEATFKSKDTPTFPYDLEELRKQNGPYKIIENTPYGNTLTLDLAKAAVNGESLGEDDYTDFLAVSISSTDKAGHKFGPNAMEMEDMYLRLDQDLAAFFTFLDEKLGEGNYLVFLTADHGAAQNPMYLMDQKMAAGYLSTKDITSFLTDELVVNLGEGEWINSISNYQVFLNLALIESKGLNYDDVVRLAKNKLMTLEGVSEIYTVDEMMRAPDSDLLGTRLNNGYNRQLSGDLMIVLKSGYQYKDWGKQGTDHGTGYIYDTHVPLLFYGTGIKSGSSQRKVNITDIAPTLSMLLKISLPSACTGEPILELFD